MKIVIQISNEIIGFWNEKVEKNCFCDFDLINYNFLFLKELSR